MTTIVIEIKGGTLERVRANDDDLQIILHDKDLAEQGGGPGIEFYPCGTLPDATVDRYVQAAMR